MGIKALEGAEVQITFLRGVPPRPGRVIGLFRDHHSHVRPICRLSAFGYKRTSSPYLANVRFTPVSGHSEGSAIRSALPPKADIGAVPGQPAADRPQQKTGTPHRPRARMLDG